MAGAILKIIVSITSYVIAAIIATYFFTWWKVALVLNVATGYTVLHIVWPLVPRYLIPNEERDSLFPAFRRLDSHKWNFYMFVPGAITLFPIRACISLGALVVLMISLKIILIGHKMGKEPLAGWR
jgi:hypothetical protein